VDEVIRAWVKEVSEEGPDSAQHPNTRNGGATDKSKDEQKAQAHTQAPSQTRPTGSTNQQKTKPGGTAIGKANGVGTGGKSNAQRANEVIMLD
jgi:hypothetical protein